MIKNLNWKRFIALYWAILWRSVVSIIIGIGIGIGIGYTGEKLNVPLFMVYSISLVIGLAIGLFHVGWFFKKKEYKTFSLEIIIENLPIHWSIILLKTWWALTWRSLICAGISMSLGGLLNVLLQDVISASMLFNIGVLLGVAGNILSFYWFLLKKFYKGFNIAIFAKHEDKFPDADKFSDAVLQAALA